MARPKKEDAGKARERIVEAFWELLAEMPYSQISIRALSGRAGVNHNTFYRHFENIDDLARKAFEQNLVLDVPAILLQLLEEDREQLVLEILGARYLQTNFERALLFARSDSTYLIRMLQDSLKKVWIGHFGIEESQLAAEDRLELTFIFGGLVSAIQSVVAKDDFKIVVRFFQRPFYRTMLASLAAIGERYHS